MESLKSRIKETVTNIRWTQYCQRLISKVMLDDCLGLAAEMAYSLLLSIIPASLFLVSLFGMLSRQSDLYGFTLDLIDRFAPAPAMNLLEQTLNAILKGSSGELTALGFLTALWSASNGANVLIKSVDRAYGVRHDSLPFWYYPLTSLIIVLSLGGMLLVALNLAWFGDDFIRVWSNAHLLPAPAQWLLNGLRWGVIGSGVTFFAAFIYALLLKPKIRRMDWKAAFPGALTFVCLWLGISLLFEFYIDRVAHYNPVYGPLGAMAVLLTWLYLSSLSVLLGGEVTALAHAENPMAHGEQMEKGGRMTPIGQV